LARQRQLTEELGGTFHTVVGDDVVATILEFARSVNGTRIVVGESRRNRFSTALSPSTADLVVRDSGDIDVQVVTHNKASRRIFGPRHRPALRRERLVYGSALAVVAPIVTTIVLRLAPGDIDFAAALVSLVLGVIASALVGGLLPALLAAVISAALADFYFTVPYMSFKIYNLENTLALGLFVVVGAAVAVVVDRSARIASEGAKRRAEADVLAALSAGVLGRKDPLRGLLEQARVTFGMQSAALFERQTEGEGLHPADGMVLVAAVGADPPQSPESADVTTNAGPGLTLALTGRPLSNSDRRVLAAFAGQTAAVLERDRLTAKAADAAVLRESEATRTALLAAVSHDLRTPLAGIKASLETLLDPVIEIDLADRQALLKSAEEATDELIALVANLLDMSRLQTGTIKPVMVPVVIDELVHRALRGQPPGAVIEKVAEDLPLVTTDAGLLERVIANVIENAIRFTPAGETVRLMADEVEERSRRWVEIRIADRGPGVPESSQEDMFRPFERLADGPSGDGVGLGLAVAKGLAEAVGTRLEVEDTPGGGLTIVISIPLDRRSATRKLTLVDVVDEEALQ
jgi:two-component system sensor histidine kinase KdpD